MSFQSAVGFLSVFVQDDSWKVRNVPMVLTGGGGKVEGIAAVV